MEINEITERVIGAAIEVHRRLGPGLLESAYRSCLCRELDYCGLEYEIEVPLPVVYRDISLECGYRVDLLIEKTVVVELKSIEQIRPVHEAQLLTYLRLGGWPIGLLINFNEVMLKDGIRRKVWDPEALPRMAPNHKRKL